MAIIVIVVIALLVVAVTTLYQNNNTRSILSNVRNLRIPVPITTSDIMSGANRVSASQRAYLMTGDDKYKEERLRVWQDQIFPAADQLVALKVYMKDESHQQIVDQTIEQLNYYAKLQNDIDLFFEKELKSSKLETNNYDSTSLIQFVQQVQRREELDIELDSLVAGDASRARKRLRNILTPLNQAQEELLINDNNTVLGNIQSSIILMIILFVSAVVIIVSLAIVLLRSLNASIEKPTQLLTNMANGVLSEVESNSKDELNQIFQATNVLSSNMKSASQFALEIGEGNFDYQFQPVGENDTLGNSLIQMRDRLLEVAEKDKKTSWSSAGLTEIGNILRKETESESDMFNELLSFSVRYIDANQGALFIVNNDDNETVVLDLVASYAYGRRKYISKQFVPGEGIVGQVYLEKRAVFMKEVPDNFVNIKSGLGDAPPKSVIVCPLIINEECSGVIEMASFKVFEQHEIDFIEELCEMLASNLSKLRTNTKTQMLLEETQQQAEKMRAQEEELRQNMEEMSATQEEMRRIQSRVEQTLEQALDAVISIDENKKVTLFNRAAEQMFGYSRQEVMGENVKLVLPIEHSAQHDDYVQYNAKTAENEVVGKGRDLEMTRKDGGHFLANVSLSKVKLEGTTQFTAFIRELSIAESQSNSKHS
ncbi:MAG: PAS domain S-box protein [Bacteroidota bacterium]